jgi:hypothetical protein
MPARAGDSSTTGSGFDGSASLGSKSALEQTLHPRGDPREHDTHLFIRRRRQRAETERVPLAFGEEDAVEEQCVEVSGGIRSAIM